MPPCFSLACATPETASKDNTAAASACTLRILPSLDISASSRADFLKRYHGREPAQPASTRVNIGTSDECKQVRHIDERVRPAARRRRAKMTIESSGTQRVSCG